MNDTDILVAIITRYLVNIGNFVKWYDSLFTVDYKHYCDEYSDYDLSTLKLDEFSFNFLVASLIWKRVL